MSNPFFVNRTGGAKRTHIMLPHMLCPRLAKAKSRGTGMKTGGASVAHGNFWDFLRGVERFWE